MAVTVVAGSAISAAGTASTAAVNSTPTLPAGTAAGDRVFIVATGIGTMATPSGWTQVYNTALGGGTFAANTGTRNSACWYRDYDGVWTMPTVTAASTATNSIAAGAVTLRKGAGDTWDAPVAVSGSDTTSGTGFSVAGATVVVPTQSVVVLGDHFPGTTTTATPTLTETSCTFVTATNPVVSAGAATGNGAATAIWTSVVTTGSSVAAAPTHGLTLGTARTGGTGFVVQGVTGPPISSLVDDFATYDAAKFPFKDTNVTVGSGIASFTNTAFATINTSGNRYSLVNDAIYAEDKQRFTAGTGGDGLLLALSAQTGTENRLLIGPEGTNLLMREVANGTVSDATTPYDAVMHRFKRVEHDGTSILWRTSPDGIRWTTRRTKVTTVPINNMMVSIESGITGAPTGTQQVEGINVPSFVMESRIPSNRAALIRASAW